MLICKLTNGGRRARIAAGAVILAGLCSTGAYAQTDPAPAPASAAAGAPKGDPVVAKVNGEDIHMSDLQEAAQGLPQDMRSMPPNVLFPMLLDQLIDRKALVIEAQKTGLDKEPDVERALERAREQALQQAVLQREVGPTLTDENLQARFKADVASKPGEEEVHARHILVDTEDQAKKIIAELKKGGDFAALAKKYSTDPGAQQGGDLGFFKKGDMVPEFAAVAFSLKPGEYSQTPVHTQFGWHVILVEEKRVAPAPAYAEAREQLRQKAIQEGVQKSVAKAREGLTVEKFNPDGSAPKATDTAEPPAPAPAAAKP